MKTKTIDSKGRLALGSNFANQLVLIDDTDPEKIVIQKAEAVPAREAWLHKNKKAMNLVLLGVSQAKAGQFSKTPPDLDADAELAAQLED